VGCAFFLGAGFAGTAYSAETAGRSAPSGTGTTPYLALADVHFDPFAGSTSPRRLASLEPEQWGQAFAEGADSALPAADGDCNPALWRSTLAAVRKASPRYAFALLMGDYLAHDFKAKYSAVFGWDAVKYEAFVEKTERYVRLSLAETLGGVPVAAALGNNDADTDDYALVPGGPLLKALAGAWPELSRDPAARDFRALGCAREELPEGGGRVLVLDDVFWARPAPSDALNETAAQGALDWLRARLEEAETDGVDVTLVLHIPPGVYPFAAACWLPKYAFLKPRWQTPLLELLRAHAPRIRMVWAAHTHFDDFKVLDGPQGRTVFHLVPSVGPNHGNSPSFQIGQLQTADGNSLDLATWTLKRDAQGRGLGWGLEYDFKKEYGRNFDRAGVAALVRALKTDSGLQARFARNYAGRSLASSAPDARQVRPYVCAQSAFTPDEFSECACAARKP